MMVVTRCGRIGRTVLRILFIFVVDHTETDHAATPHLVMVDCHARSKILEWKERVECVHVSDSNNLRNRQKTR